MVQPPVPPSPLHDTPESLLADARRIIQDSKNVQDFIIANVTRETATFANTIRPLAQAENHLLWDRQLIELYSNVSPDESIRKASQEAEDLLNDFDNATAVRDDLYDLVRAVRDNGQAETLDKESRRYVDKLLLSFEDNGLALAKGDREKLRQLKKDLNDVNRECMESFRGQDAVLWFSRDELEGLPDEDLDALEHGTGENAEKLRLAMGSYQQFKYVQLAKREETRRRLWCEYADKFKNNVALLETAIRLRAEKANLLGYTNHAELQMAGNMEKSPDKIMAFLEDLLVKATSERNAQIQAARLRKKDDLRQRGEPDDGKFYPWDRGYYYGKTSSFQALETGSFSEYFPLMPTVDKMLSVFDQLFGLEFVELSKEELISLANKGRPVVWHEDVRLFAVWDDTDGERKKATFLGYLYMDLYERPGKREGFCDLPVRPAFTEADGTRRYTSTALICAFAKPTKSKPCLLRHRSVVVLFHELGHGIHDLVAQTQYARFHGASTSGDFNEAPSQMLEQWCWIPSTLSSLSTHYSTLSPEYFDAWNSTTKGRAADGKFPDKLPEEMVQRITEGKRDRELGVAITLVQRSLFHLTVNMAKSKEEAAAIDTTALHDQIYHRVHDTDRPSELVPVQASQSDMVTTSSMHNYLVSRVYTLDMFRSAFQKDPMDRQQGLRYRRTVIGKGSSEDEMAFLTEFLGRAPDPDALYEDLGL